jgi:hypothetical protein
MSGCCLSLNLFNLYSRCPTKEALPKGFGDFKVGQVICTVKYADDVVVMDKEETVVRE